MVGAELTWRKQRELGERWRLTMPNRPGFAGSPPAERGDFEAEAPLFAGMLGDGSHLVGHSYGGGVITEAGNDPKVASLAYIAAFAPDAGESVETLIANPPPGAPIPPILPPQDGFLFLDRAKFAASFAADVDPAVAQFMANSQVFPAKAAFEAKI